MDGLATIYTAVGIAKTIPTTAAGIAVNAAEEAAASAEAADAAVQSVTGSTADDVNYIFGV